MNRDICCAERVGLEARTIVGFRPRKPRLLVCHSDAREWVPAEQQSDSIKIEELEAHFKRGCRWRCTNRGEDGMAIAKVFQVQPHQF